MHFLVKCATGAIASLCLAVTSTFGATINGPVWPGPGVPSPITAGTGSGDTGGEDFYLFTDRHNPVR